MHTRITHQLQPPVRKLRLLQQCHLVRRLIYTEDAALVQADGERMMAAFYAGGEVEVRQVQQPLVAVGDVTVLEGFGCALQIACIWDGTFCTCRQYK